VEHLEAFVLDALVTETCDVFNYEIGFTFIYISRVCNVIIVNFLIGVANKLTNGLDA